MQQQIPNFSWLPKHLGYVNPFWFIPHISTQFSFFWRKLSCQQCGNFYLFVTEVFVVLVKANNTSTLYLLVKRYFPSSRNWASVWWVWWVEAVKISSLLYLFFTKSVMFSLCSKHSPIISVSACSSPYFFCHVSYRYMVTKMNKMGLSLCSSSVPCLSTLTLQTLLCQESDLPGYSLSAKISYLQHKL